MKSLLVVSSLLFSLNSFAFESGSWSGDLTLQISDGTQGLLYCSIEIDTTEANIVEINDADECLYTHEVLTRYDLVGNELFYNGEKVGMRLGSGEFSFDFNGYKLDLVAKADGTLSVNDRYEDGDYFEALSGVLDANRGSSTSSGKNLFRQKR